MVGSIVRTAGKHVPWKKIIVETGVPLAIDEIKKLLEWVRQPKAPDARNIQAELQQTVKTLEDAFTEASQRIQMLAEAVQVLTARLTIALIVSAIAAVAAIGCWAFVLFRH